MNDFNETVLLEQTSYIRNMLSKQSKMIDMQSKMIENLEKIVYKQDELIQEIHNEALSSEKSSKKANAIACWSLAVAGISMLISSVQFFI